LPRFHSGIINKKLASPNSQVVRAGQHQEVPSAQLVPGDVIELDLPMPVRMIIANPLIEQTRNQVAVMRGPIVYCLESIDLPKEVQLEDICLPARAKWRIRHTPDLLGGVTVLTTKALVIQKTARRDIGGYRQVSEAKPSRVDIRMIPYYAWNNREEPKMTVWLPIRW